MALTSLSALPLSKRKLEVTHHTSSPMIRENRQLVTDEPVEFEK
jgi:hypothetical protein